MTRAKVKARTPTVPVLFELCLCCYRHVRPKTRRCPFCGADVAKLARDEARQLRKLEELSAALSGLLGVR